MSGSSITELLTQGISKLTENALFYKQQGEQIEQSRQQMLQSAADKEAALQQQLNAYKTAAGMGEFSIFLSANGSDSEGDGSADSPYQTLAGALETLPNFCKVDVNVVKDDGPVKIGGAKIKSRYVFMKTWPDPEYFMGGSSLGIDRGGVFYLYAGNLLLDVPVQFQGIITPFINGGGTLLLGGYYAVNLNCNTPGNPNISLSRNSYGRAEATVVLARVQNKTLNEDTGEYNYSMVSHDCYLAGKTNAELWQTVGITEGN